MADEVKPEASATDASASEKTEAATLLTDTDKGDQAKVDTAKTTDVAQTQEEKDKAKADAEKQTEKDAEAPKVPDKYDLKLPDGTLIHEGLMTEFTEMAKGLKLNNEQAQQMADLHLKSVGEFANQQVQAFQEKVSGWANDFKADKELTGNIEIEGKQVTKVDAALLGARKVLDTFGSPEEVAALKAEFNNSGLGNFKTLIKGLAKFAPYVGEDGIVSGTPKGGGERTAAEIMYPPKTS